MKNILRCSIQLFFQVIVFLFLTACNDTNNAQFKRLAPNAVILAFGDSLTYGMGASPDASYPSVLEKLSKHKVINAGVSGEQTAEGLERLPQVLEETHPQFVILCLGANDLLRRKPMLQTKENLAKMIMIIQKSDAQVMLIAVPQFGFNAHTVPDFYSDLGDQFHIPVETQIVTELEFKKEYKSDWIHFNAAGYYIFAEKIFQFLKDRGAV